MTTDSCISNNPLIFTFTPILTIIGTTILCSGISEAKDSTSCQKESSWAHRSLSAVGNAEGSLLRATWRLLECWMVSQVCDCSVVTIFYSPLQSAVYEATALPKSLFVTLNAQLYLTSSYPSLSILFSICFSMCFSLLPPILFISLLLSLILSIHTFFLESLSWSTSLLHSVDECQIVSDIDCVCCICSALLNSTLTLKCVP